MTEGIKPTEDFMEKAAAITMEWADITPVAAALAEQYQEGFHAGAASAATSKEDLAREYQRGQDDYRDALLARMDEATSGRFKQPIAKSIEETPIAPAKPAGKDPPAVAEKVAAEPEKRISAPSAPRQAKPAAVDHAPRPAGIPTTFAMVREVLIAKPGMTAKETVQAIADKWWPGLQFKFLGPDISTNILKGRLLRDGDGRLTVTEKGMNSESLDLRITQAGQRPTPIPPAQRQVVTPVAKPSWQGGSDFSFHGKTVTLHPREQKIAAHLMSAMGKGHLDARFLGDAVGVRVDAENMIRDLASIMNPKIAPLGVTIEFFKGFGFVMKEVG